MWYHLSVKVNVTNTMYPPQQRKDLCCDIHSSPVVSSATLVDRSRSESTRIQPKRQTTGSEAHHCHLRYPPDVAFPYPRFVAVHTLSEKAYLELPHNIIIIVVIFQSSPVHWIDWMSWSSHRQTWPLAYRVSITDRPPRTERGRKPQSVYPALRKRKAFRRQIVKKLLPWITTICHPFFCVAFPRFPEVCNATLPHTERPHANTKR